MPAKSCLLSARLRPRVPRSARVSSLAIRMTSVLCSSPSAPMLTSLTIQATLPLPQREYRPENTSSSLAPPISRQSRGCAAARECGAERSRGDRTDAARRASAMYRRARPPGLAESLRVQLARPGGVRYLALEARHQRWAPFANGHATEVAIAADVLNRMLELGRPKYVRI